MDRSAQGIINHIAIVLDASLSMSPHTRDVIAVTDHLVTHLAERSRVMDQETRVTGYVFNEAVPGVKEAVECVFYDRDALRGPSFREHYRAQRNTALIDATMAALNDLALIPEPYGDHAFLTYVVTDGQENRSRRFGPTELRTRITGLPGHWTTAVLVPDQDGVFEAKRFGFPADNIAVWNTRSAQGVREMGDTIRSSADRFMTGRAQGVRGTNTLFSTGVDAVNAETIRDAGLTPLRGDQYTLTHVTARTQIRDWVEGVLRMQYRIGTGFYELVKREDIQRTKRIAVLEKNTGVIYWGDGARDMLGLPDMDVRVTPDHNPKYTIFVESTSVNRVLPENTTLLIIPSAAR